MKILRLISFFIFIIFSAKLFASNACDINLDFMLAKISRYTANQDVNTAFPSLSSHIINNTKYTFIKDTADYGDNLKIKAINDFFNTLKNDYNLDLLSIPELFEAIEKIHIDTSEPIKTPLLGEDTYQTTYNYDNLISILSKILEQKVSSIEAKKKALELIRELVGVKKAIGYIKPSLGKSFNYFKDLSDLVKKYDDLSPIEHNKDFKQFPEEVEVAGTILTDGETFPILSNGDYIALIFMNGNNNPKVIYSRREIIDRQDKFFVTHQGMYKKLLGIYGRDMDIIGVIRINVLNNKIAEISAYSSNFPGSTEKHLYNSLYVLQNKGLVIDKYTHIYSVTEKRSPHGGSLNKVKLIKKYYGTPIFAKYQNLRKKLYARFPSIENPGKISTDLFTIRYIELLKGKDILDDFLFIDRYLKQPLNYFTTLYDLSLAVKDGELNTTGYYAYNFISTINTDGISHAVANSEIYTDNMFQFLNTMIEGTPIDWLSSHANYKAFY